MRKGICLNTSLLSLLIMFLKITFRIGELSSDRILSCFIKKYYPINRFSSEDCETMILLQLFNSILASESHRDANKVYFKGKEIKHFLL